MDREKPFEYREHSDRDGTVNPVETVQAGNIEIRSTERPIYESLARHQREEPWFAQTTMVALQEWAERFTVEFKLDIAEIALCFDRLPCNRFGHFRVGHNGFGLKGEIAINARYAGGARRWWQILGTLLHELLHAWQHAHGKPGKRNHHNAEFRAKARDLGLIIDAKGVTGYAATSPFKDVLRIYDVEVPEGEVPPTVRTIEGRSKLHKWSCHCPVNIRCAVTHLRAECLVCKHEFRRQA